jgi:hypothetical protein
MGSASLVTILTEEITQGKTNVTEKNFTTYFG